jgi:tetratricopeptide (TPR) repeat protein
MAIDKTSAPAWVKGVIIFVALTFVISVGLPFIASLASSGSQPGSTATPGSTTATNTIGAIAQKYAARTEQADTALRTDPKNYAVLVAQAQTYQDWATEVNAAGASAGGSDRPLWVLAIDYYRRALEIKPGDPNVTTDYSIAQFYSGDARAAVATAEAVAGANAKFAPVHFNLAVFYGALGDSAKAIAEYQRYVELEPSGDLVTEAKSRITQLQQAPAVGTTPTTVP